MPTAQDWDLLGIAPTKDSKVIRHAYAEAVKVCHPEERSTEWVRLHEAFLRALDYAQSATKSVYTYIPPTYTEEVLEGDGDENEVGAWFEDAMHDAAQNDNGFKAVKERLFEAEGSLEPLKKIEISGLITAFLSLGLWNCDARLENLLWSFLTVVRANLFTSRALPSLLEGMYEIAERLTPGALKKAFETECERLEALKKGPWITRGGVHMCIYLGIVAMMPFIDRTLFVFQYFPFLLYLFVYSMIDSEGDKRKRPTIQWNKEWKRLYGNRLFLPMDRGYSPWQILFLAAVAAMCTGLAWIKITIDAWGAAAAEQYLLPLLLAGVPTVLYAIARNIQSRNVYKFFLSDAKKCYERFRNQR